MTAHPKMSEEAKSAILEVCEQAAFVVQTFEARHFSDQRLGDFTELWKTVPQSLLLANMK